jgi:hypothetical protein
VVADFGVYQVPVNQPLAEGIGKRSCYNTARHWPTFCFTLLTYRSNISCDPFIRQLFDRGGLAWQAGTEAPTEHTGGRSPEAQNDQ